MNQKKQLSILEFSRLSGIKRENLRFYDRIGLLTPEARGDNKYRYYSRHQLNTAYMITSLRGLGMGIEEIKQYSLQRTPEKSLELMARQDARIQEQIRQLHDARQMMLMHSRMVREALSYEENVPFIQELEAEPIFLCPPIPLDMDSDEGGILSYEYAEKHGINLGYPQGTLVPLKNIQSGTCSKEERYYFKTPKRGNAYKEPGLYAAAYGRGDPWHMEALYHRLLIYIEAQGLTAVGDAFEEYPLSDLSVPATEQYGVRLEIPVGRK